MRRPCLNGLATFDSFDLNTYILNEAGIAWPYWLQWYKPPYFLIVKSFTDEARRISHEITGLDGVYAVGPGRGSGAGSLILYLLGVTDVDPIRHDLLFSRFLSENRGSQAVLKFSQS
jgi:hypothetical protein